MDIPFQWVITVAVVLAAIAFLIQAAYTVAMYKAARRLQEQVTPLVERAGPLLADASRLLEENKAKVAEVSAEAVVIAKRVREQTARISELIEETATRARHRIVQIDNRVDHTVEQVEEVGGAVKGAVMRPVREANAIMAGVRAALLTYVQGGRRSSVDAATQDEEMFI